MTTRMCAYVSACVCGICAYVYIYVCVCLYVCSCTFPYLRIALKCLYGHTVSCVSKWTYCIMCAGNISPVNYMLMQHVHVRACVSAHVCVPVCMCVSVHVCVCV